MMKSVLTLTTAALALAGCATTDLSVAPAPAADPLADNAMAVTRSSLGGTTLPNGVTITDPIAVALAECIADNATFEELTLIAANADQATTDTTISTVLARETTIGCATTALT